jgi:hypothetical protein
MSSVSTHIWLDEGDMPTGHMNPRAEGPDFPVIQLVPGASLNGFTGSQVPYLRKLAEIATRLADEIEQTQNGATS